MTDQTPNRGEPQGRWQRMSRSLAFWALVLLVPLIIIQVLGSGRKDMQELTYTEFMQELDEGNVLKVTVIDGKEIEGELRAPIGQSGQAARDFTTRLPVWHSEDILNRLESSGVIIEAEEARLNWWGVLAGFLPWLFLFGLMLFWLRGKLPSYRH